MKIAPKFKGFQKAPSTQKAPSSPPKPTHHPSRSEQVKNAQKSLLNQLEKRRDPELSKKLGIDRAPIHRELPKIPPETGSKFRDLGFQETPKQEYNDLLYRLPPKPLPTPQEIAEAFQNAFRGPRRLQPGEGLHGTPLGTGKLSEGASSTTTAPSQGSSTPPQKPSTPAGQQAYLNARQQVQQEATQAALPPVINRLPANTQAQLYQKAADAGQAAAEQFDAAYQEQMANIPPELRERLPADDLGALEVHAAQQAAQQVGQSSSTGTAGSTSSTGATAATGATGATTSQTPTEPTNPKLAAFLEEHPEIQTNQDFIQHFWKDGGGWSNFAKGSEALGVNPNDVLNYRSAPIRDLAYPPSIPDGSLPTSAAEADQFHIVQFQDPKYNESGPSGSTNCGPASLAMVLDSQGKIPPGLSPEQKVDFARAQMYPNDPRIQYIEVRGQQIPQLDADHELTGNGAIATGMEQVGLNAHQQSGWAELDQALQSGQPVVAYGDIYKDWKEQFPTGNGARYGNGEIAHFISIQGRTPDGKYIVSDPMFTGGPVEMTREQLAVFFNKDGDNTPRFIAAENTQ